jgi:hypothetical protein
MAIHANVGSLIKSSRPPDCLNELELRLANRGPQRLFAARSARGTGLGGIRGRATRSKFQGSEDRS